MNEDLIFEWDRLRIQSILENIFLKVGKEKKKCIFSPIFSEKLEMDMPISWKMFVHT